MLGFCPDPGLGSLTDRSRPPLQGKWSVETEISKVVNVTIRLRLGGVITAECHRQRADFFLSVFLSSVKAGGVEECYWGEGECFSGIL